MGDSEYSALKEAIDTAMGKIKNAKNSIKSAINTAGASMHVHVDDTDTFRSYADAIRLMYQRIWSSDDDTDAPAKCIITNKDFPLSPQHNSGYIDINDLSEEMFGDTDKYFAASSFIVDIQNPPVPIGSENNYFVGKIASIRHGTEPDGIYSGTIPPDGYAIMIANNSHLPERIIDTSIGEYVIFCTGCYSHTDGNFIEFPGGLYSSYSKSYEIGTMIAMNAYGKEETFEYLGRWLGTLGVWRRLTGGD